MAAHHSGVTSGWDPYEVWRTRVLRPRMAAEERSRPTLVAPVAALCVVIQPTSTDTESSHDDEPAFATESFPVDDAALRHELTNVIASLCLAGLTTILLKDSDRRARRDTRAVRA
jgi:hypothetical protein